MRQRSAGIGFVEILVVLGLIIVLLAMLAAVVPRYHVDSRQSESLNNARNIAQLLSERSIRKGWPAYDGKNFVLALAAHRLIDVENPDNMRVFFSLGDELYRFEEVDPTRWKEVTPEALAAGADFHDLTSYAGRRNSDPRYTLTKERLKRVVPILCDDDDGPLHHMDGLVVAYSDGCAQFVEWLDLDLEEPEDPDEPAPLLGDAATAEILSGLSSD